MNIVVSTHMYTFENRKAPLSNQKVIVNLSRSRPLDQLQYRSTLLVESLYRTLMAIGKAASLHCDVSIGVGHYVACLGINFVDPHLSVDQIVLSKKAKYPNISEWIVVTISISVFTFDCFLLRL